LERTSHLPRRVRVAFSTTAITSFVSVWKAGSLAVAELNLAALFLAGAVTAQVGPLAPWFVLAAWALSLLARAIDIESWSLFIPGGTTGRVEAAFGDRAARIAAAATLAERLLLTALCSLLIGHYIAAFIVRSETTTGLVSLQDVATGLGGIALGVVWIRSRFRRGLAPDAIARGVWTALGVLAVIAAWAALTALFSGASPRVLLVRPGASLLGGVITGLVGLGVALPLLAGGDVLASVAHDSPPPRIRALQRTSRLTIVAGLVATVVPAFAYAVLIPGSAASRAVNAPLAELSRQLAGPPALHAVAALALMAAVVLLVTPVLDTGLSGAEQTVRRLAARRLLPSALTSLHPRLGTPARTLDISTLATAVIMIASGGYVPWVAHAYAFAAGSLLVIKVVALVRLRTLRPGGRAFTAPGNVRVGGRDRPAGPVLLALLTALALVAMVTTRDGGSIAAVSLIAGLWLAIVPRRAGAEQAERLDEVDLLAARDVAVGDVEARPDNILISVRNPHALAHVGAALDTARGRDAVVMTVRLLGVDVDPDLAEDRTLTQDERALFSRIAELAERRRQPIRLLVVPARNVVDALVSTAVRLRSSEIHVGESVTLTGQAQARLLGDAWERVEHAEGETLTLVIHHHTGRTDAYHIGAHPPSFTPSDLNLIHRLWLDAVTSVGPHVHHHDVVRAALTQMDEQLHGPQRDEALAAIRATARPADELAAAARSRDFSRLRDMVRNRDAADLAPVLTELSLEDQVIVFRILPRKDAAAVFEYLSPEAQETLLKAMAQEDVASILNNMAPDDRTMFLEELPAAATRQLLTLLTPAERAVAVTLLGYREGSIGRLMTPHYVRVGETWTISQVLDHIRVHGQDSETLNVIYVVDDAGVLIDDIRIRELLLAPLASHVSDLMDRRYIALTATDDQQTAVADFRKYDRSALPVTDTAGVLIGIVTIDDVLDVAEAAATKEIQRIGGSEALDEPYMQISILRLVQKRAGWLTALFIGEMLTATAMGAFENEISKAVILALFVPLIISSGGNSGSQASTLVIRALALGEVGLGDWWRVMRREIVAGVALGAILGSIGFLRITMWSAFSDIYGPHWLLVAMTVGTALIGVVLWGSLIGSLLPFLLRRIGFDPATSSAPFVATLVDVTGLVIYFSVALVILRGSLL
jgi:magnesium transporter